MAKVDTLQSLFVEELRDLLDAEKQLDAHAAEACEDGDR